MNIKAFLVAFAVASGAAADAAGPYWLKAAFNNANSTGAYKDAAAWEDAGGTASGESGAALDPDATYIVNNGRVLRGSPGTGSTWNFGGDALVLGDSSAIGTVLLYASGVTYDFGQGGLILSNGYLTAHGAYSRNFTVQSSIQVVDGTEASPKSFIQMSYANSTLSLTAALKGGVNSVLDVGSLSSFGKSYYNTNQVVAIAGDCSEFLGLLNFKATPSTSIAEPYSGLTLRLAPFTSFAGKIKMNVGTFLKPANTSTIATVKDLDLRAGTTVVIMAGGLTNSQFVVSDSLTVEEGVVLRLIEAPRLTHTETAFLPFITAPAASLTDEVAARFAFEPSVSNKVWAARLVVRGEGATRTLGVEIPPLVYQTSSDSAGKGFPDPVNLSSKEAATSLTNGLNWSDGEAVHAGAHYRVGSGLVLRTKWDEEPCVFQGDSLTIGAGGQLTVAGARNSSHRFDCTNLIFEAGSELWAVQHVTATLTHGFTLVSPSGAGEVVFRSMTSRMMSSPGEVRGTGDVVLYGNGNTGSPAGFYYFSAMNTNWFGRTRLDHGGYAPYRITNGYWQTVCVTDERNLGGRMESFDWKALTLGVAGALRTYDTTPVTLTTNYNRGVYVDYIGQLDPYRASHSLTLNTQITMNGLLRKIGPGHLTLGGTVKFLGEDGEPCDTPRATSNIFEIAAGSVTLTSARACDGMDMVFKNGASLVLKLNPDDADLAECGLRNARTATPFTLDDGMEAIPLTLDWSGVAKPETLVTLGLATVSNAAETVAAARAMLPAVRSPWGGVRCEIVEVPRPDEGAVTFMMRLCPTGLRFLVR